MGISCDGPRELHDRYRRTRGGGPTFDDVMAGLERLRRHGVEYNVLCVLNRYNSRYPLRVYDFFVEQGVEWLQFVPLVELAPKDDCTGAGAGADEDPPASPDVETPREPSVDGPADDWARDRGRPAAEADDHYATVLETARAAPVTERSVDPRAYGEFMAAVFDEWVRNDVGDVSVRLFDQCLQVALRGKATLCTFLETCGDQVAMEHNGDVYACDHFVEPAYRRGNVHETHLADLLADEDQRRFGEYKREGLPDRCRTCSVREFCNGGCPKDRHIAAPDGDLGLNYLCAGYRTFFTHVRPYLELFERTAAEGKPLPFVMDEIATLDDRGTASA